MIDPKLIESITKSDFKENLVKYIEQVKGEVADIRNGKHTNETRIAVIEILDTYFTNKIRSLSNEPKKNLDEYK